MQSILWPTVEIHVLLDCLCLCTILIPPTTSIYKPEERPHAELYEEFNDWKHGGYEHRCHQRGSDVVVPLLGKVCVLTCVKKGYPVQD